MELLAKKLKFSKKLRIIPIGCIHLGSRACEEKKLDNLIKWILSKDDTYVIGTGDYTDLIVRQDLKRFSGSCTKEELLDMLDSMCNEQRKLVVRKFQPLADEGRIIGLLTGNHESEIKKRHSYDIMQDVCETLNVPNLGFSALIRLTLKKGRNGVIRNVVVYAHHGWGGGRKPGASMNKMVDALTSYECDIAIMGHDHQKMGKRYVRLAISPHGTPKLHYKPVILARTGTFLKTCIQGDTTYSEKNGYPPTDLGVVKITIEFKGHEKEVDLHVSE